MIVKMRKLQALVYHKEKERFLASLRECGVVHLIEQEHEEAVRLRELEDVERMAERIVAALRKTAGRLPGPPVQITEGEPLKVLHRYRAHETAVEKAEQELVALRKDEAALLPWGDFNPESIRRLRAIGVHVRFYCATVEEYENVEYPDEIIEEISRTKNYVYFVAVFYDEASFIPDVEEVHLPDASLSELRQRIKQAEAERSTNKESLRHMTGFIPLLETFCIETKNKSRHERARLALQEEVEGKVAGLTGWFPAEKENEINELFSRFPSWHTCSDPARGEQVPVLLKPGRAVSLYHPITKLFSLPNYFEIDPTPFLAPFFTLFFGLCLGDVGYGFVLLVAATVMVLRGNDASKPLAKLLLILACATIGAGTLLNTGFGQSLFNVQGDNAGFFHTEGVFSILSPYTRDGIQAFPAMTLSLYIAFIQLFLGMVLQTINKVREGGSFTHGLLPIAGICLMSTFFLWLAKANFMDMRNFTIGPLTVGAVVGTVPDPVIYILAVVGLVLMLFFNSLDRAVWIRPALGLWELYQFASGTVGNGLSYLRLFALGLSGGLLGMSFNQIAAMFITENGVLVLSWKIIFSILLVIVGHALILGLSMIGAFAHPLRLTFVEFYSSIQFRGGGKPFSPFVKIEK
jgi:V/A-type H+-transporting ATPase subunit I